MEDKDASEEHDESSDEYVLGQDDVDNGDHDDGDDDDDDYYYDYSLGRSTSDNFDIQGRCANIGN